MKNIKGLCKFLNTKNTFGCKEYHLHVQHLREFTNGARNSYGVSLERRYYNYCYNLARNCGYSWDPNKHEQILLEAAIKKIVENSSVGK